MVCKNFQSNKDLIKKVTIMTHLIRINQSKIENIMRNLGIIKE